MGWEEKGRRGRVAEILLPGGHVVTHSLEKQLRCTQIVVFIVQLLSCVQFFTTPCTIGSSVHEILQARILEYVVILFSRESSQPRDQTWVSQNAGRFFTV